MRASGKAERLASLPFGEALVDWLELSRKDSTPGKNQVIAQLSRDISAIDALVSTQIDEILHHPTFQALESGWRGIHLLVNLVEDDSNVLIRLLDISWKELVRDLDRAIEFDQSHLFREVYSAEFGAPGGKPFSALIGNYEIRHLRSREHPEDDIGALRSIAEVAGASFAPFIAGAHPDLLGLSNFGELERPIDLGRTFEGPEYTAWNSLRRLEDVRFVGLALPRILMRLPYQADSCRTDGFLYTEDASKSDGSTHLWGSAAWAFGEVLIRAFAENGWMDNIRGAERGSGTGGLVTSMPMASFQTDRRGLVPKGAVEVQLTSDQERELGELGFIPLTHCHGTEYAAFYGNQSVQAWADAKRLNHGDSPKEIDAKLSSMLQYTLCVSRFAHYLKVMARDKVGSFSHPKELEHQLNSWLMQYTTSNEDMSSEMRAKYPLREARIEIREAPGRRGVFLSVMHLRPHYQLDQMTSAVKLVTELLAGTPQ